MLHFLSSLLDLVLPRKDRVVRIDQYTLEDLSLAPTEHLVEDTPITTLMSYRTPAVDDLIRALKYDRANHASRLLADALAEYLREELVSLKQYSPRPIVLVPTPLHRTRLRERGFNQVEVVLQKLPTEFRDGTLSRVVTDVLVRTRATKQQTRLSRAERLKNVEGAFMLAKPDLVQNDHIILIDDVITTGATLLEAAKPLKNTHISLVALAHA